MRRGSTGGSWKRPSPACERQEMGGPCRCVQLCMAFLCVNCGGWGRGEMQGVKARCCSEGFPRVGWYITLRNQSAHVS